MRLVAIKKLFFKKKKSAKFLREKLSKFFDARKKNFKEKKSDLFYWYDVKGEFFFFKPFKVTHQRVYLVSWKVRRIRRTSFYSQSFTRRNFYLLISISEITRSQNNLPEFFLWLPGLCFRWARKFQKFSALKYF